MTGFPLPNSAHRAVARLDRRLERALLREVAAISAQCIKDTEEGQKARDVIARARRMMATEGYP